MRAPRSSWLKAYLRLGMAMAWRYRANVFANTILLALRVALLVTLWRAAYAGRASISGIGIEKSVEYAVMAAILGQLGLPNHLSTLPERVRSGLIATDVLRPVGVMAQNLTMTTGGLTAAVPGAVLAACVGGLMGGLRVPQDVATAMIFLVSAAAGWSLMAVLNQAIATVSFWTTDTRGPFYIYNAVATICSGALIPLWFMPPPIAGVLSWLPFQNQVFIPLQIWLGELSRGEAARALLVQLGWLAAAVVILGVVSRRALRVVVINGG